MPFWEYTLHTHTNRPKMIAVKEKFTQMAQDVFKFGYHEFVEWLLHYFLNHAFSGFQK